MCSDSLLRVPAPSAILVLEFNHNKRSGQFKGEPSVRIFPEDGREFGGTKNDGSERFPLVVGMGHHVRPSDRRGDDCLRPAKRVKIGMFAFGHTRMVGQHLIDDGIAKRWGAKYGVDLKIYFPNDDFAAFMGKSTQIIALNSLESARLVGDEGLDIVMWGKLNTAFQEFYVRTDSPYKSPADLKGKKIVIAGWDTGSAQIGTILMKRFWGLDLRKDFRVVTASWPVGPRFWRRATSR